MKKILFLLLLVSKLHAQSICVSADCKDTVRYPQDSVTLNGLVTSGEGVKSTLWSVRTGIATIDNAGSQVTVARGLSKGGTLFVFLLTGTSNKGAVGTAFDSVVYVPNKPPQAVTGPTLNDTTNTAFLSGSNSFDAEGFPLTYSWVQVSGPNAAVITTTTMANPIASGLINGTYVFRLTVTDNGGLTSTATQTVVMTPVVVKTVTTIVTTYSDGHTTTVVTTVP
jgi:protein-disulfide isomerase